MYKRVTKIQSKIDISNSGSEVESIRF